MRRTNSFVCTVYVSVHYMNNENKADSESDVFIYLKSV